MSAAVTPADGFALAMIAILASSMGVVLLLLVSIARHGKRRDPEVEALLEEVARESRPPRQPAHDLADPQDRPPWEKEPDWWRKDG